MKIAIATDDGRVSAHFGRCATYTLVDIESGTVAKRTVIDNPEHEPGFLPGFLASLGAQFVICGGMGARAQMLFAQYNIQPIMGVSLTVDETIEHFVKGTLRGGASTCDGGHHHEHGAGGCRHT